MTTLRDFVFDSNGRHGHHGAFGGNGYDGQGWGRHGGDGGDAGVAGPGASGGFVQLEIRSLPDAVAVRGSATVAGGAPSDVRVEQTYDALGELVVTAVGGDGGNGGAGGKGGDGARGSNGADATRYSSGGNGGPGGHGGAGGQGSDGAPGGQGGSVTVIVDEDSAWALMRVAGSESPDPLVRGGAGGNPGRHGAPGAGGPGGRGGSACHWTETQTYRDSQGKTATRTISRSNPGGSNGWPGSQGLIPTTPLHPGFPGSAGRFQIIVRHADGAETVHPRRYDLRVAGFELAEAPGPDADGIYEFGEAVHVSQISVANEGGMPTPLHQPVEVCPRPGPLVLPEAGVARIADSVAEGEAAMAHGELIFRIPQPRTVARGAPRREEAQVALNVFQLSPGPAPVRFPYALSGVTRPLLARYVVEGQESVRNWSSLGPGEVTRWVLSLTNVSRVDIGSASDRGRAVRLHVELAEADCAPADVVFTSRSGGAGTLSLAGAEGGFWLEVDRIRPGETIDLSGEVGFGAGVRAFQGITLRFSLALGEVGNGARMLRIQERDAVVRLEPVEIPSPGADVVLLAHNGISRAAFEAWSHLVEEELGLTLSVWSLSAHGHLHGPAPLEDGRTLAAALAGRTVILPDQPYQATDTDAVQRPRDLVTAADVHDLMAAESVSFLMLGGGCGELSTFVDPEFGEPATLGGSFRAWVKDQAAATSAMSAPAEGAVRVVPRVHSFPFMKPRAGALERRARSHAGTLARRFPARRYFVGWEPLSAPVRNGAFLGFIPRWNVGAVVIQRGMDVARTPYLHLETDDRNALDPRFLDGPSVAFALASALPFARKLALLSRLEAAKSRWSETLARAVLADLAAEQAALRARGRRASVLAALERPGSHLHALATTDFAAEATGPWLDLLAGALAVSIGPLRWWMPWGTTRAAKRATKRAVHAMLKRWAAQTPEPRAMLKRYRRELRARTRAWLVKVRALRLADRTASKARPQKDTRGFFTAPAAVRETITRGYSYGWIIDEVVRPMSQFSRIRTARKMFRAQSAARMVEARTLRDQFVRTVAPEPSGTDDPTGGVGEPSS